MTSVDASLRFRIMPRAQRRTPAGRNARACRGTSSPAVARPTSIIVGRISRVRNKAGPAERSVARHGAPNGEVYSGRMSISVVSAWGANARLGIRGGNTGTAFQSTAGRPDKCTK